MQRTGWDSAAPLLAMSLLLMPFLLGMPPLTDLPGHMARYAVMLGTAPEYYSFQWRLIGNLGGDAIVLLIAPLLGVEPATWVVAALVPVLNTVGALRLSEALGRPMSFGAILSLVFVYTQALRLGFVNYGLAQGMALLVYAEWTAGRRGKGWFAVSAFVTWIAHVAGWGVLVILVCGGELARSRDPRELARRVWPVLLPVVAVAVTSARKTVLAFDPGSKLRGFLGLLQDQNIIFDSISLTICMAAVYWVVRSGRARFDPRCAVPAGLLLAASLAMPQQLAGGDLADIRLMAPAMMMLCLSLTWQGTPLARGAAAAFLGLRMVCTAIGWHSAEAALGHDLQALDHLPQGARILNVVAEEDGEWGGPLRLHLSGYAVVRKGALVNSLFAIPGVQLMQVRGRPGFADPSQRVFVASEAPLDMRGVQRQGCDYLWAMSDVPRKFILPAGASVLFSTPNTVLMRFPAS